MALIDEFLYGLGFTADLRGGQAFDEQLQRIGDHGESSRRSLLSTITAANLLSSALEKGAELVKDVGGEFLRTAKEMEDTKITIESLYNTAAEGEEKFKWLWNFAKANPVMGLDAAKEAFLSLKNNGVEPTAAAMKAMGDTMAAMPGIGYMLGKDVGELLEGRYAGLGAIAQAGIKLHKSTKAGNTTYEGSYNNRDGASVPVKLDISDANKTIEQLTKILNDRFGGTMDAHAKTMTGLMARWGMDWKAFQEDIMDNHAFATLEDELSGLIAQWEQWAKSPDAHVMLSLISSILTAITKIIGDAIRLTGDVLGGFDKWMGSANGIAIILGSLFLAAKWTSIIGLVAKLASGFRDVAAALELVRDGEAAVAVLTTLIDPLTLIPVLIAGAVAGVATLITQWQKFQDGFTTGYLDHFFLYISDGMARLGALIDWLGGKAQIDILTVLSMTPGGLTDPEQSKLNSLHKQYDITEGEYEDKAAAKNRQEHREDQQRAILLEKAHAAMPGLHNEQLIAYIQKSSPNDYSRLIAPLLAKAPDGKMTHMYQNPEQVGPTKQLAPESTSFTIHNVIVQANDAEEFKKSLVKEAKGTDPMASAIMNFGTPFGAKY